MSGLRIPALGPRGEGWLALQVILMMAIPFVAWRTATAGGDGDVARSVQIAGGVALFGGLGLVAWSSAVLRRANAFSALPRPRESGALVVTGPYRWIRHPIYTGLILSAGGIAAIRGSVGLAALAVALAVVLDLKRRREEHWLVDAYPGYAAYRLGTKALVPLLY